MPEPVCECPDGCNGCEKLDLEELIQFLHDQANLHGGWLGASVATAANRLADDMSRPDLRI